MLLGSCISEGLEAELLTGLASVLMLLSRNERPWLSPPTSIPKTPTTPASTRSARSHALYKLLGCLDKAMYLSSTRAAIESLIRSAFFDSSVPCDLLGASFSGIRGALSSADEFDPQRALHAITNRRPHLSPLWAAEICTDPDTLSYEVLDCLPPICLPAALWTAQCSHSSRWHIGPTNQQS